jgi:hypothetical protein
MTSVQQLDELLNSGFIQAEEYQRRKDELLNGPSLSSCPSLALSFFQIFLLFFSMNFLSFS